MKRKAQYEQTVDNFAGAGGASLGIKEGCGHEVDIAINHDRAAITMHAANHPKTRHFTEDVWSVSPEQVTKGKPVGLGWFSPDCKHFSRAKGGKPVAKNIRSLAWVVIQWAIKNPPRVIVLENVREFEDWGPLVPRWECKGCDWRGTEGQATLVRKRRRCPHCDSTALRSTQELIPDPSRKGLTFKRFCGRLRNLGYKVAWKVLNAADYGAPTHRRRLFLIARNDGEPIIWPEPTHGDPKKLDATPLFGRMEPWRTAASCIDWSVPCPSIFTRDRPLAEKTMRRIAMGVKRYVLDNPRPFIVRCNHGGDHFRGQSIDCPICTLTASRDAHGLVTPLVARISQSGGNGKYANGADEPLTTIVSKAEHLLVSPLLVGAGGSAYAGKPRSVDQPAGVIKCDNHAALVSAFLSKYHGQKAEEHHCTPASEPVRTIDTNNRHSIVAASLIKHYGGVVGVPADSPLPTTTERGTQNQLLAANLVRFNHDDAGIPVDGPLPTVTTNNHAALVYSFLTKYFGTAIGQAFDEPMHTATGKHRFGLVTVSIEGEPYVIVDIGMRMLRPRELARGQGFPSYLQWEFSTMTRDEICVAAVENGDLKIDSESGTIYRLRGPGGIRLAEPQKVDGSKVNGYLCMNLSANGKKKQVRLHRLIWISVNGVPPDGMIVAHKNNNKQDNRIENLKLLTPAQNSTEAKRDGLYKPPASRKLTVEVRQKLVEDCLSGELIQKKIAEKYGVSLSRVQQILRWHYIMTGTATNQVAKIGNSVPPALARAIVAANYKPRRIRATVGGAA